MIRRIKIDGYKSFKEFTLELQPLTVIFGPNASGKSNFIDALYLISRMVNEKNLKAAFQGHRGLPLESFFYGDIGYEELLKRETIHFSIDVDVELSQNTVEKIEEIIQTKRKGIEGSSQSKKIITEPRLRYHVSIEALPKYGYLRVIDECLEAVKRTGEVKKRTPFLKREGNHLHLHMERQGRPYYHEIGLDHTLVSTALYEPHYPHISAFRTELSNWRTYYLEPKTLMREESPVEDIESLGPSGENLASYLYTLKNKHEKDFESLNLTLRQVLPTEAGIRTELREGRVGLHLSENSLSFSSRLISEGTLRLIGLLCAIHPDNPATMVAFEEPENGVHPVRIKIISDLLKNAANIYGKQMIITTHSLILPESFNDDNLYVSRREGNRTLIEPFRTSGPIFRIQDIRSGLADRIMRGDYGG